MNDPLPNTSRSFGAKAAPASGNAGPRIEPRVAEALSDRFELLDLLSESDARALYLACERGADNSDPAPDAGRVRVKVLPDSLARDEAQVTLFNLEAAAASKLSHANITRVSSAEEMNGLHFCVIEDRPSVGTLQDLLRTKKLLDIDCALRIIRQVAAALEHAHGLGVLHLMLQPRSILVDADGTVLVTDFGIPADPDLLWFHHERSRRCAPIYMSPEQVRCITIDQRSDLYSLGVILYELLTGRAPFDSADPLAVKLDHLNKLPYAPHRIRPALPTPLSWLLIDLLKKQPGERTGGADVFKSDLQMLINLGVLTAGSAQRRAAAPENHSQADHFGDDPAAPTANLKDKNIAPDPPVPGLEDSTVTIAGASHSHALGNGEAEALHNDVPRDGLNSNTATQHAKANEDGPQDQPGYEEVSHLEAPDVYEESRHANDSVPPITISGPIIASSGRQPVRPGLMAALFILALIGGAVALWSLRPAPVRNTQATQQEPQATRQEPEAAEQVTKPPATMEAEISRNRQPSRDPEVRTAPEINPVTRAPRTSFARRTETFAKASEPEKRVIAGATLLSVAPPAASLQALPSPPLAKQESGPTFNQSPSTREALSRPINLPSLPLPASYEAEAAKVVRRSGDVLQNTAISRMYPVYPDAARLAKVTGTVIVEVTVNELGDVIDARPISGPDLLKAAAVDAALGWKWTPMRVGRARVKVTGTLSFSFRK